ncbi:MAG: DUF3592 domain-containing protein [Paracoccaceae bacterium]
MQQDSVFVITGPDGIRRPSTGIKVLLFMVPCMFIALGLALAFISYTFVSSAASTQARVVTYVEVARGGYTPFLEFTTADGVVSTPLGPSITEATLPTGSDISILYDPELPAHVRLVGFGYNYGFALMVIGVGAILYLVAWLGWLILSRRIARHAPAVKQGSAP